MFDLYDIYDTSEITIIILMVFIFILVLVVFMLFLFSKGSNINIPIELPKKEIDYEKKYNDLIEKKGEVPQNQVKYSPSEFSTLLKYNPILPYSAFTWDIINNSYLDYNEQSNFDDKYFNGHVWILCSLGLVQFLKNINMNDKKVDIILNKILSIDSNLNLSEQYNIDTQKQISAEKLTWNYSELYFSI